MFINKKVIVNKKRILIFLALTIIGVGYRFLWRDIPNLEPITLVCLLAGTYLGREKFLIPIITMFVTDLFFGINAISIFVYSSFLVTVLLGKNIQSPWQSMLRGFYASTFFFLWTNFGVWLLFNMYPKNFAGLTECFIAGIPFYRNTLISAVVIVGIVYSVIYFWQLSYNKIAPRLRAKKDLSKETPVV